MKEWLCTGFWETMVPTKLNQGMAWHGNKTQISEIYRLLWEGKEYSLISSIQRLIHHCYGTLPKLIVQTVHVLVTVNKSFLFFKALFNQQWNLFTLCVTYSCYNYICVRVKPGYGIEVGLQGNLISYCRGAPQSSSVVWGCDSLSSCRVGVGFWIQVKERVRELL